MDAIVGKALTLAGDDPETLVLVCSDHGFATWRRSVNYNTWLVKNGFMTLKTELGGRKLTLEDLFGNKQFWPYVDWSKTRAYSLGLGNIYVNLKGREPMPFLASDLIRLELNLLGIVANDLPRLDAEGYGYGYGYGVYTEAPKRERRWRKPADEPVEQTTV